MPCPDQWRPFRNAQHAYFMGPARSFTRQPRKGAVQLKQQQTMPALCPQDTRDRDHRQARAWTQYFMTTVGHRGQSISKICSK
eukprot:1161579-Pelagomonas_calceolata.AAC.11